MIGRHALLDAALGYVDSSPQIKIFPADPRTKRPLIKTGADHAEHASTDPATIERWILVDSRAARSARPRAPRAA